MKVINDMRKFENECEVEDEDEDEVMNVCASVSRYSVIIQAIN